MPRITSGESTLTGACDQARPGTAQATRPGGPLRPSHSGSGGQLNYRGADQTPKFAHPAPAGKPAAAGDFRAKHRAAPRLPLVLRPRSEPLAKRGVPVKPRGTGDPPPRRATAAARRVPLKPAVQATPQAGAIKTSGTGDPTSQQHQDQRIPKSCLARKRSCRAMCEHVDGKRLLYQLRSAGITSSCKA